VEPLPYGTTGAELQGNCGAPDVRARRRRSQSDRRGAGMSATKSSTDPIFGKIEAHRAAVEAMNAALAVSGKMSGDDDPSFKDADRKSSKAGSIEMKALRALPR
jgi:hypothetical protein